MTTAHRPTWAPAVGGEEQGGSRWFKASIQTSAKNLPGHTKLKFRQTGQNTEAELQHMDLKAELEAKERKHFNKSKGMIEFEGGAIGGTFSLLLVMAPSGFRLVGGAPSLWGGTAKASARLACRSTPALRACCLSGPGLYIRPT